MKTEILGVCYDNLTPQEAIEAAETRLREGAPFYCVTPNAEMAYEALKNPEFCALLNGAGLTLPDGAGVVLAGKLLKTPLKSKVAGVDFAQALLPVLQEQGKRLYLLGGKPGIGELAAKKMLEACPKLQICGIADGYFRDETAAMEAVAQAHTDVLFVCLGSPKQELFMQRHCGKGGVTMMIGLGGTLDAIAGTVKRAPKWMIRLQLEWLYRLIKEPKRFKRMLRLPKYAFAALGQRLKGKKHG